MGENSNTVLDHNVASDAYSLEELLTKGKSILNEAIDLSRKMEASISAISDTYDGIEKKYRVYALGAEINNLSGKLQKAIYQKTLNDMDIYLARFINDVPVYDNSLAQQVDNIQEVLNSVKSRISELGSLLEVGDVSLGYTEFKQRLQDLKADWDMTTEKLTETLAEIEGDMLGVTVMTVRYSSDPVNLSTGNFVYDHEDLKIGGEIPLSFHRYYNSRTRSKGCLGRCFVHNYESYLEERAEKGKITVTMGDGQKKTFRKKEDGTYQSLHSTMETLTEEGDGYILSSPAGKRTAYAKTGQMVRQEDSHGRGITFSYDKTGKLEKAKTDNGAFLLYVYNEAGQLDHVADHTGRNVEFSYEKGKLKSVRNAMGSMYGYRYAKNGRIEETVNPRGYTAVKNTYDEKRRVIRQDFPDGGHMEFGYDDSKKQVILTERNGSRTIYVHDGKYRNTDILYEDGTKEHFGYNGKNQRILYVDRNGNSSRMAYDDKGNLTQSIDALGGKTNLTYNADNKLILLKVNGKEKIRNTYDKGGNLISSVGADGNGNRLTYNEQGRLICIENADKSRTNIAYDDRGNVKNIRNAGGTEVSYQYDCLNRVIRTVDGNGNATTYEYNDIDKISKVTDPSGNCRIYDYNESGKISRVTDYDGYAIEAAYNEIGKISRSRDKEGNVTEFFYDSMWNTSRIAYLGGGTISYKYDENNRLCEEELPGGGSIRYTYDGNGNRTGITDAEGNRTAYIYDALDRIIKIVDEAGAETCYDYDGEGNIVCITDALGNKTSYIYDGMNRCVLKTDAIGNTTAYSYDAMGNMEGIRYPNGSMEKRFYENGKPVEIRRANGSIMKYVYDGNGNCICMESGTGEKLTVTYDSLNRRKTVTNPDGSAFRYEYDAVGNVTKTTDGNGNETHYTYTPNGNLSSVTDALGNETKYEYDAMGHLIKAERIGNAEDGEEFEKQTTVYQWNRNGFVTGIIDPLGIQETFGYDKNGRLTDKWDRDGYHTAYSYDKRGLLKEILYADGTDAAYSYDTLRRLREVRDSSGITRIMTDALGRVTSVTYPEGRTVGYEWGSMGEKLRLTYPDGKAACYSYNERGQLTELSAGSGAITYTYDSSGRMKEKKFPGGTVAEYAYTEAGKLGKIHYTGKGFEEEYSYLYDRAGNKVAAEKKRQGVEMDSGIFSYNYDALNRLTEVCRDGQLLRRYTYDSFGNRMMKEDYSGGPVQTRYRYNAGCQLISLVSEEMEENYTYDRRGNLTAVRSGNELQKTFTFDAANRMSSASRIEESMEKREEYRYDVFGNRTGQDIYSGERPQDPERQIHYTIDLTRRYHNLLMLQDSAGLKEQTFYWDGNVAAVEEDSVESYYLQDDLGSPMQLFNGDGEAKESYGYDEFGRALFPYEEKKAQPFGYTGYQMEEGGLYFAQARRYDAGAGRFISRDRDRYLRFRHPSTLNQYIYCENSPTVYADPSGNDIEDFYPTRPEANAPVQVTISGNTITIDAYVEITGDINTSVEDATAHDLVIEGIKKWAGTYDNVYGHEAEVKVNVYEGHNSERSIFPWVKKQEYLEIELIDDPGRAYTQFDKRWGTSDPGAIIMYTSRKGGKIRDELDYANTIAHEFGHVLGIDDGYEDSDDSRPLADMLAAEDLMVASYDKEAFISDIDIQMLIMAALTNEYQRFMKYEGYIQSKGVFIYEMCDTD